MNRVVLGLSLSICVLLQTPNVGSFEIATHRALTTRTVRSSSLDDFLRTQLGINGGVDEVISGQRIIEWIEDGSVREDDGLRFFNHFHNPLKSWSSAGLEITGGRSSILWAQDPAQGYAWKNARDSYFDALTGTTQDAREGHFADTFRALGQLIHLVQDAAVPAHTRNDPHPPWNPDALERFTEVPDPLSVATLNSLVGSPVPFSPSVLECNPNNAAPVRIACITDTTDSDETQATPSAGTNQGLAEYANANFLSRETIFKNFTFPRLESVDLMNPFILNNRRYFTKVADGETGFFLVAEGTFTDRLLSLSWFDKGFTLDPLVTLDYASLLLPRAVGYSAGLIDYFFRNFMGGSAGNMGCTFPPFQTNPPFNFELGVAALRSDTRLPGEQTGTGRIVIVVHYRSGGQSHYFTLLDTTATLDPELGVSWTLSSEPFGQVPADATELYFTIAYRGPLGEETDAVIGGVGDFFGLC